MKTRAELPGLELVKLIALACMLVDHVDLLLFDRAAAWTYELGRFALPAFFGAYAVGLARSVDPMRSASGLVVPGIVAQLAWHLAGVGAHESLNVLVVAAFCAACVSTWRESRVIGFGLVVAAFAVYPIFEGGYLTLAVFWFGYLAASTRSKHLALIAAAPVFAVTPGAPGLLGLAAPHLAEYLPGVRRGLVPFAWLYAAHLAVLAALRSALAS